MAKRQITKQQAQRIKSRRRSVADEITAGEQGLLMSRYGKHAEVEAASGVRYHCKLRQHLGDLVAGDQVVWESLSETEGIITSRLPRHSVFKRADDKGNLKVLAANVDLVLLVIAPLPAFYDLLIFKYLIAIQMLNIDVCLVLNKIDLISEDEISKFDDALSLYQKLGYPLLEMSAETEVGISTLDSYVKDKTIVMVGQTGVGKSSLIQKLVPHEEIKVGEITGKLGKHTTTAARLYHLKQGGYIIDSPGVRDFRLWKLSQREVTEAMFSICKSIPACRFRNCLHTVEPDCEIIAAVGRGDLDARWYQGYLTLLEELNEK